MAEPSNTSVNNLSPYLFIMSTVLSVRGREFLRTKQGIQAVAIVSGLIGGILIGIGAAFLRTWIVRRKQKPVPTEDGKERIRRTPESGIGDHFGFPRGTSRESDAAEDASSFLTFDSPSRDANIGPLSPHLTAQPSLITTDDRNRRPTPSTAIHIPTDVFVSQMNALYPRIGDACNTSSLRLSFFRPQTRSNNTDPEKSESHSPQPATDITSNPQNEVKLVLPPIQIHPLMHKESMDRIVGGAPDKFTAWEKSSTFQKVKSSQLQSSGFSTRGRPLIVCGERA